MNAKHPQIFADVFLFIENTGASSRVQINKSRLTTSLALPS